MPCPSVGRGMPGSFPSTQLRPQVDSRWRTREEEVHREDGRAGRYGVQQITPIEATYFLQVTITKFFLAVLFLVNRKG